MRLLNSIWEFIENRVTYRHVIPAAVVGFLIMFVSIFGITKYSTSKPDFCLSCHYWQAYSDFLQESKVHPNIDCAQCHAKHEEFIPKDYQADQERMEANCLRCHEDIPEKEEIKYKYNEWNITIPHKMHIQDIGLKCTDCHMNVMHDRHTPSTNRPQMETCFSCHEPIETPCSACHPKDSVSLPKTEIVTRSKCRSCHQDLAKKHLAWQEKSLTNQGHESGYNNCNQCHSNSEQHGTILIDTN